MRILLTNDDGIHAPGLKILERIARELSDDVVVVAPETDQSGVAHSLSLSDPLRLREISAAPFRRAGHADRLRHHGRPQDHGRQQAGPRALRRQSRPERRRGRHLFRHDRRRDGGHAARRPVDRAVAGLWRRRGAGAADPGTRRRRMRRRVIRKILRIGDSARRCWSTSISRPAAPTRSKGVAVTAPGQARRRIDAHRGAARRARHSLLLADVPARRDSRSATTRISRRWRRKRFRSRRCGST